MEHERSVLIVDDDEDICTNVKDILEDLGYRTDTAHDGPSALHLVSENSYDVALLDFKMPGMDGATLYQEMKKLRSEIVAIMVTAYAGSDGVQKAIDAGTWKVLRKPMDIGSLLPLVEQAAHEPVVLLVDDDDGFCSNLWQVLRQHNYRVSVVHDEAEGVARAGDSSYDVALIDIRLANGNGGHVVQKIREANPLASVFIITGFADELDASHGADSVFAKPLDVDKLLERLKQIRSN